jgi:hypothetical protein
MRRLGSVLVRVLCDATDGVGGGVLPGLPAVGGGGGG